MRVLITGETYNAASGRAVATREIVDGFLALAQCPIGTRTAPERTRPTDVLLRVGDAGKLRARTGWKPVIPLEQSLADVLAEWRHRV